jgi:CheY-like chemotaxis protein
MALALALQQAYAESRQPAPVCALMTAHPTRLNLSRDLFGRHVVDMQLTKPVFANALDKLDTCWLQRFEPGSVVPAPTRVPRPRGRLAGLKVLLAEDHPVNQMLARELLQREACEVSVAVNGLQAVHQVESAACDGVPFDVVLMDMQMPIMDGVTATRSIRAIPAVAGLPIIAMTANAAAAERERCLEAGMNDHLAKPFDVNVLVGLLKPYLR